MERRRGNGMIDQRERINDPQEAARLAVEDALAQTWTATPGIVVSVDLEAQTLVVQPAIQGAYKLPDGSAQRVNMPLLVDVPIVWPRAGGFALTFPIAAGDEVLVVFGSRAMDSWWQSGGVGPQVESRMHDLSDGFAILAPCSQPKAATLVDVSPTTVQLRDEGGKNYLEITPAGKINFVCEGDLTIKAGGKFIVECTETDLKENVKVTGDVTATGTVTGQTDVAWPNVPAAKDHTHDTVMVGPAISGKPTAGS